MSFVLYTVFGSLIRLVIIIVAMSTFNTTSIDRMINLIPANA